MNLIVTCCDGYICALQWTLLSCELQESAGIGWEPTWTRAVSFGLCFLMLLLSFADANVHCPTNKFMTSEEIVGDRDSRHTLLPVTGLAKLGV